MKSRGIRIALATVVMMAMAGAATAQGMGVYGGLNLGFGQFGADVEQRVPTIDPIENDVTYSTTTHITRFNAFALTPTVGITPWRGNGNFVLERMAFEFQLAMKWGKYEYGWAAISSSEIRPGVLAKFNFSFADWAALFGNSGPAWGDRLATYVGLGFGIPIRTAKISYSSFYKRQIEASIPNSRCGGEPPGHQDHQGRLPDSDGVRTELQGERQVLPELGHGWPGIHRAFHLRHDIRRQLPLQVGAAPQASQCIPQETCGNKIF